MSLVNRNTGMEAPRRKTMDIFYENDEDDIIIDNYEQEPPKWKPRQPARRDNTSEKLLQAIYDLSSKVTSLTTDCSNSAKQIRTEGDRLIEEFHKKYDDITQKEVYSFVDKAEYYEKEMCESLEHNIQKLDFLNRELDSARAELFTFNKFKRFLFWFGCFTNIGAFSVLLALLVLNYL